MQLSNVKKRLRGGGWMCSHSGLLGSGFLGIGNVS